MSFGNDGFSLTRYPSDWTREDWLAWRQNGIGGSDIAAVCGLSPWATPMTVWLDKTGRGVPVEETEPMRWGNILEPIVADEFEEATGLYVHHRQTLAVDDEFPWRRATLDGLAADHLEGPRTSTGLYLGVVQIKTTRSGTWDALPDNYVLQVQWEMGITRQERAFVPCLHHGNAFRVYEVDFDPGTFEAMASMADRFWRDHVEADVPPAPDGNPATTAALRAAFPESDQDGAIDLDDALAAALRELPAAKNAVKAAEQERDAIENRLRLALGEASVALADGIPVATWKTQRGKGRVDLKALEADHPELVEEYRGPETTSRVLRLTKDFKNWIDQPPTRKGN
jgi:putative phage-type endonuclease